VNTKIDEAINELRDRVQSQGFNADDNRETISHLAEDILQESNPLLTQVQELTNQVAGFGALQDLLDDPSVEEIWINEPGRIFIAQNGRSQLTSLMLDEREVRTLAERLLARTGRRIDLANPFVDATLPDGSRLHIAIPDVTSKHWAINIRKFVLRAHSLEDLVAAGTLTNQAATFLQACVSVGLNIIVAGATQAGKTTLMNALLNSAPAHERVITCEEVFELQLLSPDWVAMQTRQESLEGTGEITLRRLIKEALRMRPSRLVVGEVRHEECLELLIAMNSGMPSMCSIHANNVRSALSKLCLLPMLAGSNVTGDFIIPTVANVVDIVVHTALSPNGLRQVQAIGSVTGRVEGNTIEIDEIFSRINTELVASGNFPSRRELFSSQGFDLGKILNGPSWQ
jgi:pilus assembly protein CpaF